MTADRRITIRAFAKINLSLRVLGTRPDGYHELRTVFQSIALHDTLTFRFARGPFAIDCADTTCPADRTNLIWRAAEALWAASGRGGALGGVKVGLEKRIPMQAGLGGGSSDAAAALRVLGRRWKVDAALVREIAGSLGADVPYFLEGGTVLGVERGDLLFPLIDIERCWVVLVLPDFGVSTRDAYRWWDEDGDRRRSLLARGPTPAPDALRGVNRSRVSRTERHRMAQGVYETGNDLQVAVAARHPEIERVVNTLWQSGATHTAMSGSGSAIFGLFVARPAAERAAGAVRRKGFRTIVTRTRSRREYRRG